MTRGFDGFWFMSLLREKGINFVIRMKANTWAKARKMVEKQQGDIVTNLYAGNKAVANCKERNLSRRPLKVRLVRHTLKNGQDIVLVTSLTDPAAYTAGDIAGLYAKRWKIEERFKFLKERMQLAAFTGKTVLGAYQDFHAKILMANYASILTTMAAADLGEAGKGRHPNRTRAFARVKDFIVELCKGRAIGETLDRILTAILNTTEKVKPDRVFQRSFYPPRKYHIYYKPA